MKRVLQPIIWTCLVLAALGVAGCATTQFNSAPSPHPDVQALWCVLPPSNNTSTPYAGERVQQQLAALLGAQGLTHVLLAPAPGASGPLPIDNGAAGEGPALEWARHHEARYALEGSVDEWDYKVGLDGQPAVGITLRLLDLESGQIIWSGAASGSGGSREGLAALSERTLAGLLKRLLT
ncbi:MAG: penicillin-binding protein activator LpoB [Steroidobacteraceae bacterium]